MLLIPMLVMAVLLVLGVVLFSRSRDARSRAGQSASSSVNANDPKVDRAPGLD